MSAVNNQNNPRKTGYAYYQDKQKSLIKTSVKLQLIILVVLLVIVIVATGCSVQWIVSAVTGSMCAIIPNLYYAYFSFRYIGAQNAGKVLSSIYFAEMLKFILVVCLLSISYSVPWLKPVGILMGFVVLFSSVFILPLAK